ncbi:hypothetical protein AB0O75_25460 [Streptomyces sp. NPDC088921]|uniref:hypothetical protein n=1 Tax=Streptomyces sp. NPDC088921 TaxID=3155062 RepID=UPI003442A497
MGTADQRAAGTVTDVVVLTAYLVFSGVVACTALYAPRESSERAFRLVDLMKGSAEPAAPTPEPPVRRRDQQGGRG